MKVTFCTYDDVHGMGGPNPWLRRLLPELHKHGINPKVLCMTFGPGPYPTIDGLRQSGISVTQTVGPEYTEQKIQWLLEELASDPPDVFVPNVISTAYFAARWVHEAGIPTVGVMHSDDTHHQGIMAEFLGAQPHYQLSGVACCSQYLEQYVLEKGVNGTVIRWLPYGAPIPAQVAEPPNPMLRLIYAGRLVEEQKRISEVTRAICRAVKEVPGTEASLYGDGVERPVVENILNTVGQGLPISLEGWVDSDKIQQKFTEHHVFVLLSDYEGLPVALMEAMACGVVPICLRIRSGIPELVEDGVTGLLVDDRGDDFVNAVRRLREEPGLWERLSKACHEKIMREYSNEVCGERWAQFLVEMKQLSTPRRTITIPKQLDLPPPNPGLTMDTRIPFVRSTIYGRSRAFLGRVKRKIIGVH